MELKETESGIRYFDSLPEDTRQCLDIREFFQLKPGKSAWKKENVEKVIGMPYLLYSPTADRYYFRETHEASDFKKIIPYIKDKNIYIFTDYASDN